MKVVIVSDIHDNLPNLNKALAIAKDIDAQALISCGDTANIDTVKILVNSNIPLYLVRGNCDNFVDSELPHNDNLHYVGRLGVVEIDGHRIGLCHEPFFIDKVMEMAGDKQCEFIFYGHTHKPWEERLGAIRVMTPGTLSGMFTTATYAVWDTSNNDVKLILVN